MRGTIEGSANEIAFVRYFNSNKDAYSAYLENFSNNSKNLYLVRVTTKQYSTLSEMEVPTRADAYLIHSVDNNIGNLLASNDNFLTEELLYQKNVKFSKVKGSGISIKMENSHFQILKLVPKSFYKLFNVFELGAGASLYVENSYDFKKNINIINGWNSSSERMNQYFYSLTQKNVDFLTDISSCSQIKEFCNNQISKMILSSKDLQGKIFNGIGIYEEPYTAWFFSSNLRINKLNLIPFSVTTGSGRSRGDYTLVLKPR